MLKSFLSSRGTGELGKLLAGYRGALSSIVMLSAVLNVLALTGSLYLLVVYSHVLMSNSLETLASSFVIIIVLFAFQGVFDNLRASLLRMVGHRFDRQLAERLQQVESELAQRSAGGNASASPLRDLDQIRSFLLSSGPAAIIDLPWVLFFLIVLSLLHPALGLTALVGALALGYVTLLHDRSSRLKVEQVTELSRQRNRIVERVRSSSGVIQGLSLSSRMNRFVLDAHWRFVAAQTALSDTAARFGSISRAARVFIQAAVLTVGAVLVIKGSATAGIIFASSILAGRALAPVDQAIANWRGFIGAQQAWVRLNELLRVSGERLQPEVALPAPSEKLTVERLTLVPPGSNRVAVGDVAFSLAKGDAMAIVGPSGSGKSSIARGLVGAWPPSRGAVRLDGAPLSQYSEDALREGIGYLPQEVELFAGSVAQNISGFDPAASSEAVVEAAKAAGVHDLILRLPQGYDTLVGEHGSILSGGQRQRLALARALYGNPFLLVLDEPDSNLDPEGEAALGAAISRVRERGGIVVVVTHRMVLMQNVNVLLVMRNGKQQAVGPRDQILKRLNSAASGGANSDPELQTLQGAGLVNTSTTKD